MNLRRKDASLSFLLLDLFGSNEILVMHSFEQDEVKLLTDSREVHVRSAAERAEILVGTVHGPVHTPKAKQVTACVHYGLVNKLQADDALELLRLIVRLHCTKLVATVPARWLVGHSRDFSALVVANGPEINRIL